MEIDLSQAGLRMVLKDYQEEAMKLLWDEVQFQGNKRETDGADFSSREVWNHVNKTMMGNTARQTISRASIINYLNAMCDDGFLGFHEVTGKGGHRRIYHSRVSRADFWDKVISLTAKKFAEATGKKRVNLNDPSLIEKVVAA